MPAFQPGQRVRVVQTGEEGVIKRVEMLSRCRPYAVLLGGEIRPEAGKRGSSRVGHYGEHELQPVGETGN
jgi:hypothetical protein